MAEEMVCYRHPDRRAGVSCQRCGRPICPSCMSDASVGFHCPECARGGRQRVYTARSLPGIAGRPVVTYTLVGINLAVYLAGLGMGSADTRNEMTVDGGLIAHAVNGAGELIGVAEGEWYRIVTSGFLHANLVHVGFNMYLLYLLGMLLEPAMGRLRFALVYFFSLLAGSFGALLVDPNSLTVGASGAVFGLMGAAVVVSRSRGQRLFDTGLGGLILLNLVFTFVIPGISVGGHVGGLVGGLLSTWLLLELPARLRSVPAVMPVLVVLGLGAGVVAGCLWAAGQWMDPVFG